MHFDFETVKVFVTHTISFFTLISSYIHGSTQSTDGIYHAVECMCNHGCRLAHGMCMSSSCIEFYHVSLCRHEQKQNTKSITVKANKNIRFNLIFNVILNYPEIFLPSYPISVLLCVLPSGIPFVCRIPVATAFIPQME